MREIKFRAWDGGRMVAPAYGINRRGHLAWSSDYDLFIKPGYATTTDTKGLTVMQYTGLKDKNGVEIYESDVVEHDGQVYPVYWNETAAAFDCPGPDDDDQTPERYLHELVWAGSEACKVIGNIYENPEILK
jgi:hypothetical protein